MCGYIRAENLSKKMHQHSSVFLKLSGLVQILQSRALRQGVGVVDSSRSSFAKGKPGLYVFFLYGADPLVADLDVSLMVR